MRYRLTIHAALDAPRALESLYREALAHGDAEEFRDDLDAAYAAAPDSRLLEAWHWRLTQPTPDVGDRRAVNWRLVLPLSALTALVLWWLSGSDFAFHDLKGRTIPVLLLLATPVVALSALAFVTASRGQAFALTAALGTALAAVAVLAVWRAVGDDTYRQIATTHMPILAWTAVGIAVMGVRSAPRARFAFLAKSIEAIVVTGVYALGAIVFAMISLQMFRTLGITPPDAVNRLLAVGGVGLMPLIAIASVYDVAQPPEGQDFRRGLSRMVSLLPRLLLVLTLLVLVVYVAMIPANFLQPFRDRDVLITYNVMLFAVVGMLVGATPVTAGDLPHRQQRWLRRGIVAVAALVLLVGLYALAAVLYRTVLDRLTLNRLIIIGWDVINIVLLGLLLVRQRKAASDAWIASLHATFSTACAAYAVWAAFAMIVAVWMF